MYFDFSAVYFQNSSFINNYKIQAYMFLDEKKALSSVFVLNKCFCYKDNGDFGGIIGLTATKHRNLTIRECSFLKNLGLYLGAGVSVLFKSNFELTNHSILMYYTEFIDNYSWKPIFHEIFSYNIHVFMKGCKIVDNFYPPQWSSSVITLSNIKPYTTCYSIDNLLKNNKGKNGMYIFGTTRYYDINGSYIENFENNQGGEFYMNLGPIITMTNSRIIGTFGRYSGIIYANHFSRVELRNIIIERCSSELRLFVLLKKSILFAENLTIINTNISSSNGQIFYLTDGNATFKRLIVKGLFKHSSIIYSKNFILNISNSIFENYFKNAFLALNSKLNFSNVTFKNFKIENSSDACLIVGQENSIIDIIDFNSFNTSCSNSLSMIINDKSIFNLKNANFNKIGQKNKGNFIFLLKFSELNIFNVTIKESFSPGFFVQDQAIFISEKINIINKELEKSFLFNSFVFCFNCKKLQIKFINFYGIKSNQSGGVIKFQANNFLIKTDFLIQNSKFIKCGSMNFGGVLAISSSKITIKHCIFDESFSKRGGVAYYYCSENEVKNNYCLLNFENNSFTNNKAKINGGIIYWLYKEPIFSNNNYKNNSAFYGSNFSSFPIKLNFTIKANNKIIYDSMKNDSFYFFFKENNPSLPIPIIINFSILDTYNQKIKEVLAENSLIQSDLDKLLFNKTNLMNFNRTKKKFIDGILSLNKSYDSFYPKIIPEIYGKLSQKQLSSDFNFVIEQIYIAGTPTTIIYTNFTCNMLFFQKEYFKNNLKSNEFIDENQYRIVIPVQIGPCIRGQIFNEFSKLCENCLEGSYSLNPKDNVCHDCILNAKCLGGTQIIVEKGYWRASTNSIKIYKCLNSLNSCNGKLFFSFFFKYF